MLTCNITLLIVILSLLIYHVLGNIWLTSLSLFFISAQGSSTLPSGQPPMRWNNCWGRSSTRPPPGAWLVSWACLAQQPPVSLGLPDPHGSKPLGHCTPPGPYYPPLPARDSRWDGKSWDHDRHWRQENGGQQHIGEDRGDTDYKEEKFEK